jgi:tetratricopeptide (TPR) repeat protein
MKNIKVIIFKVNQRLRQVAQLIFERVMRKRYILLQLFLIVQSAVCIAQQDRIIDSLLNALTNQKKDTSKVRTLLAISNRYRTMNANPTISYILRTRNFAEDALLLAKELKFRNGIADSYIEIGFAHRDNYPERLKCFYLSLKLRNEIGDKKDIAECYYYIGMCYGVQGNFPEQLASLFTALKIYKEIYDNKQIYQLHIEFATTYNNQGNYPEALKSHFAA